MKNLIRKILKRFIKIETKQVYCLKLNKRQIADYWLLFGFCIGVSYSDVKPLNS